MINLTRHRVNRRLVHIEVIFLLIILIQYGLVNCSMRASGDDGQYRTKPIMYIFKAIDSTPNVTENATLITESYETRRIIGLDINALYFSRVKKFYNNSVLQNVIPELNKSQDNACDPPCDCLIRGVTNRYCALIAGTQEPLKFNAIPHNLTINYSLPDDKLTQTFLRYDGSYQLWVLIMRKIGLIDIENSAFQWVTGLIDLDISGNNLRIIPFSSLPSLQYININDNIKLESLDIRGLPYVSHWSLSNCSNLKPIKILDQTSSITGKIDISHNQWNLKEMEYFLTKVSSSAKIKVYNVNLLTNCGCESYFLFNIVKNRTLQLEGSCFAGEFSCKAVTYGAPNIVVNGDEIEVEFYIIAVPFKGYEIFVIKRGEKKPEKIEFISPKLVEHNKTLGTLRFTSSMRNASAILNQYESIRMLIIQSQNVYTELTIPLPNGNCKFPCECHTDNESCILLPNESISNLRYLNSSVKILTIRDHSWLEEDIYIFAWPNMEGLIKLEIINCGISELPRTAFNSLHNLTHLSLRDNRLSVVPTLRGQKKLKILDLSGNNLTVFDGKEIKSDSIEELYLADNYLEKIDNLDALRKLKLLDLTGIYIDDTKLEALRKIKEKYTLIAYDSFYCDCIMLPIVKMFNKTGSILFTNCYNTSDRLYKHCSMENFKYKIEKSADNITASCSIYSEPMPIVTWIYKFQSDSRQVVGKNVETSKDEERGYLESTVKLPTNGMDELVCSISDGLNIRSHIFPISGQIYSTKPPVKIDELANNQSKYATIYMLVGCLVFCIILFSSALIICFMRSSHLHGQRLCGTHKNLPRFRKNKVYNS